MTSSGTYNFALSNADVLIEAFGRCGKRRTELLAEHMQDGRRAINLAMVELSIRVPNLWAWEEYTIDLTEGTAQYSVPARSVMILSCFIRTGSDSSQQDRICWPISQYDYASLPNKTAEGFPSQYFFNRLQSPTVTFYLVPDADDTYTAHLQITRQLQDANLPGGETPDVPYRFLDALCAESAYRLARSYAPDKEEMRRRDAKEAWALAATNDTENVPLSISPALGGYYRV